MCLVAACYDVNDDGCTHHWRDGIQRNDARLARKETDGIADKGNDRTTKDGARHQNTMVGLTE